MAQVKPFKAVRYNLNIVPRLAEVLTPPYDIISAKEQQELYQQNPYNIIRLEHARRKSGDNERANRFTRAACVLEKWLAEKILLTDPGPAYYLYEQKFNYLNQPFTRRGLFAVLKLESYLKKTVLPHEKTLKAPKAERFTLLQHLQCNTSPVFMLYPGPDLFSKEGLGLNLASAGRLLFEVSEKSGARHLLYAITEQPLLDKISTFFADRALLIADGHHRYETALAYAGQSNNKGSSYLLVTLVSLSDPGLFMLPTHRLLGPLSASADHFLKQLLHSNFIYKPFEPLANTACAEAFLKELAVNEQKGPALGFLTKQSAGFLTLKKEPTQSTLALTLLHENVIGPLLQQVKKQGPEDLKLTYPHSLKAVQQALLTDQAGTAFILNPLALNEIYAKAQHGQLMPEKSTYFYPKLPAGLLLYHHRLSF